MSRVYGIPIANDLGVYLGISLVQGRKTRQSYDGLLARIRGRLQKWKANSLNLAGRFTLAKSVLATIPLYTMQSQLLPRGVCDDIDKIVRNFIWNGCSEGRKIHLLCWETLCLPRSAGRQGLQTMRHNNLAFMAKLA